MLRFISLLFVEKSFIQRTFHQRRFLIMIFDRDEQSTFRTKFRAGILWRKWQSVFLDDLHFPRGSS